MIKKLFCVFMCLAFVLSLGGCSAKPGVEFDGKDIWTDPATAETHGSQEILERAITAKDADKLYAGGESTDDKGTILKFQKWLSQMKLSPLENQTVFPAETDSGNESMFWLQAGDKGLISISIYDNGYAVVSADVASSYAAFYSIDNFEDIKEDYEKLLNELKK